jgi:hypothetical protein
MHFCHKNFDSKELFSSAIFFLLTRLNMHTQISIELTDARE